MTKINTEKEEIQLVVFKLAKEEYTVPIESVREIIMPQPPAHLPKAPDFIEGVINLRGNTIPVIDGRKRFNMPVKEKDSETRVIVLELENNTMGLVVDSVSEVIRLKTDSIDPPPVEADKENQFIMGIGKYNERLLILLDPTNFLNLNETVNLQQTVKLTKDLNLKKESFYEYQDQLD